VSSLVCGSGAEVSKLSTKQPLEHTSLQYVAFTQQKMNLLNKKSHFHVKKMKKKNIHATVLVGTQRK